MDRLQDYLSHGETLSYDTYQPRIPPLPSPTLTAGHSLARLGHTFHRPLDPFRLPSSLLLSLSDLPSHLPTDKPKPTVLSVYSRVSYPMPPQTVPCQVCIIWYHWLSSSTFSTRLVKLSAGMCDLYPSPDSIVPGAYNHSGT